ncbi:type I-U CRISPR-associated RAMP protein Csb1/Cas7u [Azoarcus sp. DN11]|uniref:type I-G CRISPR-associated RAMP protein Csb1/Cas7g n=1 Tax=Azoarcus sp. DN11 TaxID=356837 RepID=UPI0013E2E0F2|nr:type I-U CRISPR-associated RAMP protein Csb1/Cas7u [Azoarcus sp. DN11]
MFESITNIRLSITLQPVAGNVVYPPTFAPSESAPKGTPASHNWRPDGSVVLDTPQSQANRIEDAIMQAMRAGVLAYPDIRLEIPGEGTISVLELSHRAYDATLFHGLDANGTAFRHTAAGQALINATPTNATAVFEHAPIQLLVGAWDSHAGRGVLAAKFQRILTGEIVGLDARPIQRTATKIDPLDIRRDAATIYAHTDASIGWTLDAQHAQRDDRDKPVIRKASETGLGNTPSTTERGAIISSARHDLVLTATAVRRLRFPDPDTGALDPARDRAGQDAALAFGLYAISLLLDSGYNLRSGCQLVPEDEPQLELIGRTLKQIEHASIAEAHGWFTEAMKNAAKHGLSWRKEPIVLHASPDLVGVIAKSRELAGIATED